MRLPAWVPFAMLAALAFHGSPSDAAPASPLRTTLGIVETGEVSDSLVWFDLVRFDQRFAFDPRALATPDTVLGFLKDSAATNSGISVHYYVDGATIGFGETKPTYLVHDITYNGQTVLLVPSLPKPDPNAVPLPRDVAAANLARGIALAGDPDAGDARTALTLAVDSEALEPALKALALKTRHQLNADDALQNWRPGMDRDKLLAAALDDARAWQALAPDDPHASAAVAEGLAYLGAFGEAVADYRRIMAKWPDELFWSEVRIAAIYRRQGHYTQALATLDDLVRRDGPQTGMAYRYHRGWILEKAGRLQEAVDELTAGLKDQPDFSGAFSERACASGRLGRIQDAMDDWQRVLALREQWGHDTASSPGAKNDDDRSTAIVLELKAALARDPRAPTDATCVGFWDWGEENRGRSALLPPETGSGSPDQ